MNMPSVTKGSVRRGQLVTTYGVGALVALEEESFIVAGIDRWQVNDPNIHEPRLERLLDVHGFVLPPATENGRDIPVFRFPVWCSCPVCSRLNEHRFFTTFDNNRCNTCNANLAPTRFVVCCAKGHIDDFPYFAWVHAGAGSTGNSHQLTIRAGGTSASLRDIEISCSCGLSKSMEGAFGKNVLREIGYRCSGNRPWLGGSRELCTETPRTFQRGASKVWFPTVYSSISIPPWSEGAFRLLNRYWSALEHAPDDALVPILTGMGIARGTPYSVDDLVLAVQQRRGENTGEDRTTDIRWQEYEALTKGKAEADIDQEFVCIPSEGGNDLAASWFDRVMVVKRLREVRALQSFTRVTPHLSGETPDRRAQIYETSPGWLPAIEVRGEGVFLELNAEKLRGWESDQDVVARAKKVNDNYMRRSVGSVPGRVITPRLLLIHTLAHVLITQWSLDCGYPAASLRERLYVSDRMAGLLIYTATSDSAGSLGGVVAQAGPSRLDEALREGIGRAAWCSADPLCIESDATGVDALNLAACHACSLLPEVSCEEMNLFLDRGMLIGTPTKRKLGFFAELITAEVA